MTTANKITVVRILMIPVFVTLAIYYGESIQEGRPQDWMRFTAITVFLRWFAWAAIRTRLRQRKNRDERNHNPLP